MENQITRTFKTTTIYFAEVSYKDGALVMDPGSPIDVVNRTIKDNEAALKIVRKQYGKNGNYVITDMETTEKIMGCTVEDFLKIAALVERPASQQKK